jgi:cytochrome bd ubiquinol oxidase subunit II
VTELADLLAAAMLLALIAYALSGGADFGGGVWDLLASGPRAAAQREAIAHAIGPIWEANHVWLIAVVVLLFAGFPPAFAEIATRFHIPLSLLLVGIVLRGSSFVFRSYDAPDARLRWGRVFAISSTFTPVLLGVLIGALSLPPAAAASVSFRALYVDPWLQPFPLLVGLFALAQFAFLAAVYLSVESDGLLREDFRRRALGSALAVAVLGVGVAALASATSPSFAADLLGEGTSLALVSVTALVAGAAFALLWRRRWVAARLCAVAQVALILLGWGLAQHPYLVADSLTLHEAAAPPRVLRLLLIAFACGSALLLPALAYLLRTFKGSLLGPASAHDAATRVKGAGCGTDRMVE